MKNRTQSYVGVISCRHGLTIYDWKKSKLSPRFAQRWMAQAWLDKEVELTGEEAIREALVAENTLPPEVFDFNQYKGGSDGEESTQEAKG